jgi:hypothetical protein
LYSLNEQKDKYFGFLKKKKKKKKKKSIANGILINN